MEADANSRAMCGDNAHRGAAAKGMEALYEFLRDPWRRMTATAVLEALET